MIRNDKDLFGSLAPIDFGGERMSSELDRVGFGLASANGSDGATVKDEMVGAEAVSSRASPGNNKRCWLIGVFWGHGERLRDEILEARGEVGFADAGGGDVEDEGFP